MMERKRNILVLGKVVLNISHFKASMAFLDLSGDNWPSPEYWASKTARPNLLLSGGVSHGKNQKGHNVLTNSKFGQGG